MTIWGLGILARLSLYADKGTNLCLKRQFVRLRPGVLNIRLGGQTLLGKDSNLAHWESLKNVKDGIKILNFHLYFHTFYSFSH